MDSQNFLLEKFFLVIRVEKEILDKDPSQPTQLEATHRRPTKQSVYIWDALDYFILISFDSGDSPVISPTLFFSRT